MALLGALKFFPALSDAGARAGVKCVLRAMVDRHERLDWLVSTFLNRIGKWHGPAELRAVYCTRFKPADGIEGWSEIPGFTAADSERAYLQEQPRAIEGPRHGEMKRIGDLKRLQ